MRKSTKPYVTQKAGRWYYRLTWLEAGKRREKYIPLPGGPDSPEFDREYWAIRSGKSEALAKPVKDTWGDLVRSYQASPKFKKLAPKTKKSYRDTIDWILEKNAKKSVTTLTRQKLRDLHIKHADTPRKADALVQVVSILTNFARRHLDWKIENPAEGMELHGKQREYEPWPDWMVAKLNDAPEAVRTAAELILGTGQRPNAAITMRHDQFDGDWMTVTDEKGDDAYEVFCPQPLRDYLSGLPRKGAHVLAKNLTQPIGYASTEKAFRAWRATLGERATPYSMHGLRKLSIIRLAEAGCTDAQIQAITNQSAEMVAYYRKRASRKALSRAAHGGGTEQVQNENLGKGVGK